ncbi:hypothetical protein JKP88DRAFT_265928 [Tribonema minus]|uniref:Uncharacterized protein n=1 Tax=Tribonema minus TaxID=303371 RepID=A0A836C7Z1_9STRA|nr:hypothetical protein JKP88DRAFT_265928 [Tribonema minus]
MEQAGVDAFEQGSAGFEEQREVPREVGPLRRSDSMTTSRGTDADERHALLDKVALVKDAGQYRAGSEPYKLLETKEIEDKIRLFWRECRYPENYLQGRQEAVADLRERDKLNNFWNVHMRTVEKGVRNPYHAGDLIVVLQAVPQKRALDKYVMSMGMVGRDAEGVMHIEGVDALNPVNTPRKPLVLQEESGMDRLRVWRPAGYEWAIYHRDANLLSQTAMTEIVQVAPAWAQPKGRFPRHHKMGDYVTVSAEERLLLVPTHTLTPLVLPKGAQVRFALAAGDKRTRFGTVVEDFVAASEKLFVNHLDAINPYVWVRDNDGGRTWQVPVSELDLRGDPWWSRPVLPVAPFKGEGWNLWPGPTLAWLVENEEDTSVALSIKPARLRWGIPNYARKTGRTMTIEHVPVRAEFLFSGWQQDKRSPAPVLRVKDSAIAPNSGWEVRQAMGGSSAQGERAGTSAHDAEVEVEPQRKLKPPPGQPSSARSSLGQRQNAESGSGGDGDDGDARSTRSSLRQRKNAAGGGGGGGGDDDDDSSDTDADARHDRSSRNRSRDARGGKGDRPPRRAQGRSGGGGGDDGGSSGDGGGVEEDSEGKSEVEVDALADNAEFGAKSGTHIVATQEGLTALNNSMQMLQSHLQQRDSDVNQRFDHFSQRFDQLAAAPRRPTDQGYRSPWSDQRRGGAYNANTRQGPYAGGSAQRYPGPSVANYSSLSAAHPSTLAQGLSALAMLLGSAAGGGGIDGGAARLLPAVHHLAGRVAEGGIYEFEPSMYFAVDPGAGDVCDLCCPDEFGRFAAWCGFEGGADVAEVSCLVCVTGAQPISSAPVARTMILAVEAKVHRVLDAIVHLDSCAGCSVMQFRAYCLLLRRLKDEDPQKAKDLERSQRQPQYKAIRGVGRHLVAVMFMVSLEVELAGVQMAVDFHVSDKVEPQFLISWEVLTRMRLDILGSKNPVLVQHPDKPDKAAKALSPQDVDRIRDSWRSANQGGGSRGAGVQSTLWSHLRQPAQEPTVCRYEFGSLPAELLQESPLAEGEPSPKFVLGNGAAPVQERVEAPIDLDNLADERIISVEQLPPEGWELDVVCASAEASSDAERESVESDSDLVTGAGEIYDTGSDVEQWCGDRCAVEVDADEVPEEVEVDTADEASVDGEVDVADGAPEVESGASVEPPDTVEVEVAVGSAPAYPIALLVDMVVCVASISARTAASPPNLLSVQRHC